MTLLTSFFWRIVTRLIRLGQQAVIRFAPRYVGAYTRLVLPIMTYRIRQMADKDGRDDR